jgi:quercetin dioxygenase-like cupin family protein
MKRTLLLCGVAAAAGVAAGLAMPNLGGAQSPVSAKNVLQSDLKGGIVEETLIQEVSFAPGAATPWHIHPDGHEVAYLLEGALTVEVEGQGKKMLKPGEGIHISPNVVHRGLTEGSATAKVLVVRLKGKDKPIMVPVQR